MSLTPTVKVASIKDALRVHHDDSPSSVYPRLHATCRQTERNELSRGESELVPPLGLPRDILPLPPYPYLGRRRGGVKIGFKLILIGA